MILSIALSVILGGITLFGLFTLYQDHQALRQVVSFLNAQIAQQQEQTKVSE